MRFTARFPLFVATALFAIVSLAQAQDVPPVRYPSLPETGASAQAFVPAGWRIEKKIDGDLNGDGSADLVLVLKQDDPKNRIPTDAGSAEVLDTNPRILAVAWAVPGGGYTLAVQNHTLIPRHEEANLDDVFDETGGVFIAHGTLQVALHHFASMGSWSAGTETFTFRHKDGKLVLIGYDDDSINRGSGEENITSINFSTGKVKETATSISADGPGKVRWRKLPSARRWTLDDIGQDFSPMAQ